MASGKKQDVYLKRMRYFLELVGNPDKDLSFIHVTGTAGKGSVTNMVHEVLYASGKRVGSFTSPSVTTSIEKIKVNNVLISPEELDDIVEYLKPYIDQAYREGLYGRPSYFEIFLAIAFIYFKKQKCELVVLEVGLGGRFDATNVIESPLVTAITNIDYDHTEILGNALTDIAYDKIGIVKKGSVFFTTERRKNLLRLFKEVCKKEKATFNAVVSVDDYKENNKALVIAVARHLGVGDAAVSAGIGASRLPCRFECMQDNPQVILDGAHNRAKIKSTLYNLMRMSYKKLHLVIGTADNKKTTDIIKQVVPLADSIYFTRFQHKDRKCTHPKILLQKSKVYIKKDSVVNMYLDSEQAMEQALKKADSNDVVLVVGSFFLAGELRKRWYPEEWILQNRSILAV